MLVLLHSLALAQSPVTPALMVAQGPSLSAASASELLMMLEQNRQEVSDLRGQVERLQYEIEQLKRQDRDRYIDLDRRLLELSERVQKGGAVGGTAPVGPSPLSSPGAPAAAAGGAGALAAGSVGAPGGTATGSVSATPVAPVSGPAVAPVVAQPASAEAKAAYDAAYELIKEREYEKAVDAMHAFINRYPESDLTPNAYYWLGEVYLVLPRLEQAKQAFIVVVSKYPDHRKAPDAFYKLGVTYHRLGSLKEAETFLRQTVSRFPGTSSAALAEDYLKKLK